MSLNKALFEPEIVASVKHAFQNRLSLDTDHVTVFPTAYPLVVLKNFVDPSLAEELKKTVASLPFKHKATDLFDFYQSPDLKPFLGDSENPIGKVCAEIFSERFAGAIGEIIGKPLGTEIDFAAQKYCKGQYLLCHDDRLESRRVAFVLYLVDEEWSEADGGHFQKYALDHRGGPSIDPVDSFLPAWNTLVFFEVSMWSHHQVAEVLGNLPRLSVAGWLHDAPSTADTYTGEFSTAVLDSIKSGFLFQDSLFETIKTTSSHYTFTYLPDSVLLDLVKPETLGLPASLDYPTWPICISLNKPGHRYEISLDQNRLYAIHIIESTPPVSIKDCQVKKGQTIIFKGEHLVLEFSDSPLTFLIWSFQLPQ